MSTGNGFGLWFGIVIVHKGGEKLAKVLVVGLLVGPIGSRRMLGRSWYIYFLSVHINYITYGC